MTTPVRYTVSVPATTANLGPGFDIIGLALSLENRFTAQVLEPVVDSSVKSTLSVSPTSTVFPSDLDAFIARPDENLLLKTYQSFFEAYQRKPVPAHFELTLHVPFSRGLGSSSTAIVAGLMLANAISGVAASTDDLLGMAIAIEGHPDNVTPALLGGLQCCLPEGLSVPLGAPGSRQLRYQWPAEWGLVFTIPPTPLSTKAARAVLPSHYDLQQVTQAQAALHSLLNAVERVDVERFSCALMADTLHEPYRRSLISEFESVALLAKENNAMGTVMSGAGSTLLSVTRTRQDAETLAAVLKANINTSHCEVKILSPNEQGALLH